MSEMVKRVARKLAELDGRDPDGTEGGPCHMGIWLDEGEANWTGYTDAANSIIAAMGEPTEAMVLGGWRALNDAEPVSLNDSECCWRAMADAALK